MEIKPGAVAIFYRTFDQRDFDRFAALSGDDNPIHVDPGFAGRTRFGRTVCHGMLLYSTICRALTDALGPGFVQREQELMFVTPTYTGEEVAVRLEVTAVQPDTVYPAVETAATNAKSAVADSKTVHEEPVLSPSKDGLREGSSDLQSPGRFADIGTVITRPDGSVACQGRTRVALPGEVPASTGSVVTTTQPPEGSIPGSASATTLKWLALGQAAEIIRTFSKADLQEYRDLSGDINPAFSDAAHAPAHGWPTPQVPGGLLGGLFSTLLGTRLPGRGTNWLKQRLGFPAPCYAGQEVTARVEIVRLRPEKDLVNLRTTCTAPGGQVVCEGEALVLVKDLEHA
jgi:acyl dehydratase